MEKRMHSYAEKARRAICKNNQKNTKKFLLQLGKQKILEYHTATGKNFVQICIQSYNADALEYLIQICGTHAFNNSGYIQFLFKQIKSRKSKRSLNDSAVNKIIGLFYHADYELDELLKRLPYHSTWIPLLMDKGFFPTEKQFSQMMKNAFDTEDMDLSKQALNCLETVVNHPKFMENNERNKRYASIYFVNYLLSEQTNLPTYLNKFLEMYGNLTLNLKSEVDLFDGDFLIIESVSKNKRELFNYLFSKGVHLLDYPCNILEHLVNISYHYYLWITHHDVYVTDDDFYQVEEQLIERDRLDCNGIYHNMAFEDTWIYYILMLMQSPLSKSDRVRVLTKSLVVPYTPCNNATLPIHRCIKCGQEYHQDLHILTNTIRLFHVDNVYNLSADAYEPYFIQIETPVVCTSFCSQECQDAYK